MTERKKPITGKHLLSDTTTITTTTTTNVITSAAATITDNYNL